MTRMADGSEGWNGAVKLADSEVTAKAKRRGFTAEYKLRVLREVARLEKRLAQGLAVLRELGLPDDAGHVNPNGGAIALGHPLGMSGARLVTTAMYQLHRTGGRYALCTMCIGVGQGIALILERV